MEEIELGTIGGISPFSDEEEEVIVSKVNQEFRQENKLKGVVREFTIFNDIHCSQLVKKKHGGTHKFHINLTYLDPKPQRIFILAWRWLITAGISAGLSLLLVYLGWFSSLQLDKLVVSILASLSVSFCFIAFLIALLRTSDRVIMYSRYGHAPIFELVNKNPDRESFSKFIKTLHTHIVKAHQVSQLSPTDQLTLEVKELRRLKDENAISEDQYEQAKKRIFGNSAFNKE